MIYQNDLQLLIKRHLYINYQVIFLIIIAKRFEFSFQLNIFIKNYNLAINIKSIRFCQHIDAPFYWLVITKKFYLSLGSLALISYFRRLRVLSVASPAATTFLVLVLYCDLCCLLVADHHNLLLLTIVICV